MAQEQPIKRPLRGRNRNGLMLNAPGDFIAHLPVSFPVRRRAKVRDMIDVPLQDPAFQPILIRMMDAGAATLSALFTERICAAAITGPAFFLDPLQIKAIAHRVAFQETMLERIKARG